MRPARSRSGPPHVRVPHPDVVLFDVKWDSKALEAGDFEKAATCASGGVAIMRSSTGFTG